MEDEGDISRRSRGRRAGRVEAPGGTQADTPHYMHEFEKKRVAKMSYVSGSYVSVI